MLLPFLTSFVATRELEKIRLQWLFAATTQSSANSNWNQIDGRKNESINLRGLENKTMELFFCVMRKLTKSYTIN